MLSPRGELHVWLKGGEVMLIVIGIVLGVLWAVCSYRLAMSKGRKSFAPFAAILGFLLGLIGLGIVACVPSKAEAKKRRADANLQVLPGVHEEDNLPVTHSADEHG